MLDHEQEIRFAAARRRAIARDFYRLNAQQQEAVLATQGPLLLLAGAAMLCFGAYRGEAATVLSKAIKLCLECVGIG